MGTPASRRRRAATELSTPPERATRVRGSGGGGTVDDTRHAVRADGGLSTGGNGGGGDDANLRRVGEDHRADIGRVLREIVERGRVPTRLDPRFARAVESLKVGGEGFRRAMVDASLHQEAILPVQRAGHRIPLVVIDSGVVHGGAQDTTPRLSERLRSLAAAHAT